MRAPRTMPRSRSRPRSCSGNDHVSPNEEMLKAPQGEPRDPPRERPARNRGDDPYDVIAGLDDKRLERATREKAKVGGVERAVRLVVPATTEEIDNYRSV